MREPRTIEGQWWIHGDDKPAHFGVLTYDPDKGLKLSVKIPRSFTVNDVFSAMAKAAPQLPQVIYGTDKDERPVTLFGCGCPGPGMSQGLETYAISSMAALLNWRAISWREAKFSSAGVEYSLFHNWMGRQQVKHVTSTDGQPAIAVESPPNILVEISPGVRLRIEATCLPRWDIDSMEYRFGHRAWFHFSEPRSIEEIHDSYVGVFLRLLCLLTGSRVFSDSVQLVDDDPFEPSKESFNSCQLLQSCEGVSEAKRDRHHMIASYAEIADQFPNVVRHWFACDKRFAPVLDLYLNVKANPMTAETRFLLLAQALEVYHGRSEQFTSTELPKEQHRQRVQAVVNNSPTELQVWVKERLAFSNQKTLAQRIDDLSRANTKELEKLAKEFPNFAAQVRHTRNYHTHYSEELKQAGKVAKGVELMQLGFILEDLLEICLLKEIGVEGKAIARILKRASGMKFVSLDSPEPFSPSNNQPQSQSEQ